MCSELFRSLEERVGQQVVGGENVVIRGYGISMTTLEEVFMRIGQQLRTVCSNFQTASFEVGAGMINLTLLRM